jgi:hypothetical protein
MRELSGKSARLKEERVVNRNKPKSKAAYKRVPKPEATTSSEG